MECSNGLSQVEKARGAFHKACQKESWALEKEQRADGGSETPEKRQKITAAREKATEEKEKVRSSPNHYLTLTPLSNPNPTT